MRQLVCTLEYKWSHQDTAMEQLWIRREIGDRKFRELQKYPYTVEHEPSKTLPADVYCEARVWVTVPDDAQGTHWLLSNT